MRILVVTQYFWPENFRINDLVGELVERGHTVSVLTGLPNYPDGKIFPEFIADKKKFSTYRGANVIRVPIIPRGSRLFSLFLNFITFALSASTIGVWKLRGQPYDIIFVYEPSPITVGIPAIFLRFLKRAPIIFWVLDLWPETLQAIGLIRSRISLGAVGVLVRIIYRYCDLILAQSKSFLPHIKKYTGENSQVEYFPGWSELNMKVDKSDYAQEIDLKNNSFNIVFTGNIGQAQDFPVILDAATRLSRHQDIRWLIVGDGRMASWVKSEIGKRNLQNTILMLGAHAIERMPSFLKHADVLLLTLKDQPIFSMTIPAKLQSYLTTGLPILAATNGEVMNLVRQSECGLACASGDFEALADAVLKLKALSKDERARMGSNGLRLSLTEFNRAYLIDKIELWMKALSNTLKT